MEYTPGINMVSAAVLIGAKGASDTEQFARVINRILQMDGDRVAREIPAQHQLLVDGWGRDIFLPSMVYMPEKDRLLLRFGLRELPQSAGERPPMQAMLIASDDHGRTWSPPIDRANVIPEASAPGMVLSYLGAGKLLEVGEATGENTRWFSPDYGETWDYYPASHSESGFPFYVWDPCYSDKDPTTGESTRVMIAGYRNGMERCFDGAKKLVVMPDEWRWKHDPRDEGLAEEWFKGQAMDTWPRTTRIDRHWTVQGEPGGIGWYATDFEMPESSNAPVMLFGGVDGICDAFIDGTKVGEQKLPPEVSWDKPFHIHLKNGLEAGKHTIVIRVEKEEHPDWNSGIYQPIWIVDGTGFEACDGKPNWPPRHALIRFSYDAGKTWPEEVEPPSWNGASGTGVNEVSLCRAANGDIIAACRLEHPKYWGDYSEHTIDHYCGLGVSVSKDNGYTWSPINILYEMGHMHPSVALMPNGDLVMTYVERMGALLPKDRAKDDDGYSRWAVEAVVSRDNGQTWDLEHKYILGRWSGPHHAQSTSTVLLPDGWLLTAFGSGYLSRPEETAEIDITHEVCLLRWRPE